MDKTESTVRIMLTAIEAPLYDIGVLSQRGMLPGLDGISAAAVLDRLSLLNYAMPTARTSTSAHLPRSQPYKTSAYIRRTMEKARRWAGR